MFAKLLRGPSADTLTLEVIGLVKCPDEPGNGMNNSFSSFGAEQYARRIDRLLQGNSKTLDREVAGFLRDAHRHLDALGKMDSMIAFDKNPGGVDPVVDFRPDPKWEARYRGFQTAMDDRATQLFDRLYLSDARERHAQTAPANRAKAERKHPDLRIANRMGRF